MELTCAPCDCTLPAGTSGRAENQIFVTAGITASVTLRAGRQARVACHEGTVWVTLRGDNRDHLLRAGESVWLRAAGRSLARRLLQGCLTMLIPALRRLLPPGERIMAQGMPEALISIQEQN